MKRRGFLSAMAGIPAAVVAVSQLEAKPMVAPSDDNGSFAAYAKWRMQSNPAGYMNEPLMRGFKRNG